MAETYQNPMIEALRAAHNIDTRYQHARQEFLFSSIRLGGYADQFGRVSQQAISLFQTRQNSVGQGFETAMHRGVTNFSGGQSTMPTDKLYVAKAFGIRLIARRNMKTSRAFMKDFLDGVTSISVRRGDNTNYDFGPVEFWPSGRYGLSSRSVAAVGMPPANGDLTLVDYAQNGDSGMRVFEPGSELVFKPGATIDVALNIHEELWLTPDGGPNTDPSIKGDIIVQAIFDGYSLSSVQG